MEAALRLHRDYERISRHWRASRSGRPAQDAEGLPQPGRGQYGTTLDYEGKVAKSCMHCHQVREAERLVYRAAGEPIPDEVLFPYPIQPCWGSSWTRSRWRRSSGSHPAPPSRRDGLRPGDAIVSLAGQPLLAIADLQWVLHNAPATAGLSAAVRRDETLLDLTVSLPEGWRRGDISWRATTWDLRRMGLGGMRLDEMTDEQRQQARVAEGRHGVARQARRRIRRACRRQACRAQGRGHRRRVRRSGRAHVESDLLAYSVQRKRPRDEAAVLVLRDGEREDLEDRPAIGVRTDHLLRP
jgi:hypothetical protein